VLTEDGYGMEQVRDGGVVTDEVPALLALNLDLRNEYVKDCQSGLKRWNRILEKNGFDDRVYLPHVGFNRQVGLFSSHELTPKGDLISADVWASRQDDWLPSEADRTFVQNLMRPVYEPGKIAGWIAPPSNGINGKPFEYEYVHLA
jgi:benzoyl-CoA 2,3-dioxygenase component B